jgi:leucine efflux protein
VVVTGDLVLITLSGLGFSALMQQWPALGMALTVAGAFYVAWLGWGLWRSRPDARRADDASSPMTRNGFAQGLVLTLTNPKPILFFGAFFPLFIDRSHNGASHWMASFYALGAVFEAINLIYFAALIGLVARLRRLPALAGLSRGQLHRFSGGGLMLCSALMLATALRTA